jgi:hypothetical protein
MQMMLRTLSSWQEGQIAHNTATFPLILYYSSTHTHGLPQMAQNN